MVRSGRVKSPERLLIHLETTPLGFIEWDQELVVTSWSKRAEHIFGWTSNEIIGSYIDGLLQVPEDDEAKAVDITGELFAGTIYKNCVKQRNITKSGKFIWCEWFNSVIKDKIGKVISIMSLVQDVTPKMVADEKITRAIIYIPSGKTDLPR